MNVAICAVVKDTPDYLMKAWIDHHLKITKNILIIVDVNSKPIYYDDHITYIYLNENSRREIINTYNYNLPQENINRYMVEYVRNNFKSDWVTIIDDDEILNINIDSLESYEQANTILAPWVIRGCNSITPVTDLNMYYDIHLQNIHTTFIEPHSFMKPIINLKKYNDSYISIHRGIEDGVSVFIYEDQPVMLEYSQTDFDSHKIPESISHNPRNCGIYIEHYMIRSFQEWIESYFDRGDFEAAYIDVYNNEYWGRRFTDYFEYYNIVEKCNPQYVYNMLKEIGRLDILDKIEYPLQYHQISAQKKLAVCMVCKNTDDQLLKYTIEENLKCGVDDIYILIDRNSNNIYESNSKRVHYINWTPEIEEQVRKLSIYSVVGEKARRQVGIINYMYKSYRDMYEWITFIDDDEILNIDPTILDNYTNYHSIYLPWKNYHCPGIDSYNVNEQIYDELTPYGLWMWKSIINTRLTPMINTVHFGDLRGVTLDYHTLCNRSNRVNRRGYFVSNIQDEARLAKNSTYFIKHIYMRSFSDLISRCFDRGDIIGSWNIGLYRHKIASRKVQLWFKINNIPYSLNKFVELLQIIDRYDIIRMLNTTDILGCYLLIYDYYLDNCTYDRVNLDI